MAALTSFGSIIQIVSICENKIIQYHKRAQSFAQDSTTTGHIIPISQVHKLTPQKCAFLKNLQFCKKPAAQR